MSHGNRWSGLRKRGDSNPRSLAGRSLSRCSVSGPLRCSPAGQRSGGIRARPARRHWVVVSVDVTPAPPVPRAAACPLTGWQRGSMVARATTVDARQDHASADRSGSCRSGAADGLNVWRTGGTAMPLSATGLRFATARALVLPCGRPIVMNAVIVMDFMTL